MAAFARRLQSLLRHFWWDDADVQRVLPSAALARIEARVAASEQGHSGQIRVAVEPGLPWSYLRRGLPARARAITLFGKLRVWDTEYNNGVLIYLLLAERSIEIVADRGLAARVPQPQWTGIVDTMRQTLHAGRFEQGLLAAVDAVDALLRTHFARTGGAARDNELPDAPVVL